MQLYALSINTVDIPHCCVAGDSYCYFFHIIDDDAIYRLIIVGDVDNNVIVTVTYECVGSISQVLSHVFK